MQYVSIGYTYLLLRITKIEIVIRFKRVEGDMNILSLSFNIFGIKSGPELELEHKKSCDSKIWTGM